MNKLTQQEMEDYVRNLDDSEIPEGATHYSFVRSNCRPSYQPFERKMNNDWYYRDQNCQSWLFSSTDYHRIPLSIRAAALAPQVTLEDLVNHPNFSGNKACNLPAIMEKLNGDYSHLAEGVVAGLRVEVRAEDDFWVDGVCLELNFLTEDYRIKPQIDHSKEFVTGRRIWYKGDPVIAAVSDDIFEVLYVDDLLVVEFFDDVQYEQPEGSLSHKEAGFYCE